MFCNEDRTAFCAKQLISNIQTATFKIYLGKRAYGIKHSFSAVYYWVLPLLVILQMTGLGFTQNVSSNNSNCTENGCSFNTSSLENFSESCKNDTNLELMFSSTDPLLQNSVNGCSDFNWKALMKLSRSPGHGNQSSSALINIRCTVLLNILDKLEEIRAYSRQFRSILQGFDCNLKYSTKKNCTQCLVSYSRWLCMMKFYKNGLKPCVDVCFDVYKNCPVFEPDDSYGGYSVFECPKEVSSYISYGPSFNCKSVKSLLDENG